MNSDGAGSSGVKLSGEDEGFFPENGDAWVEIDLNDEPGSLLDSLNVSGRSRHRFVSGNSWTFSTCRAQSARSPYLSGGS